MALRQYKSTSPGRRFATVADLKEVTRKAPERSLTKGISRTAGRNAAGRITTRHRGGGHKRRYRIVDFRRDKVDIPAKVAGIEYDPNRSALIALLHYADGEKRYILAPVGLKVGATILAGDQVEPMVGNALPLARIPLGQTIHNLELEPGRGACLVRTAGAAATLMSREGRFAQIKLPSGEIRMLNVRCMAVIGQVGNVDHGSVTDGKAGRARWRGRRPTVRGVAMNPVDHPMGGGEGRSSGGGHPVSPWGRPAKGGKTRDRRKPSSRFIVKRRVHKK